MTVRTTRFGGTDWADGDVLFAADQNETIVRAGNEPWHRIRYDADIDNSLIKFSANVWQSENRRTIDAGSNWAAPGYGVISSEEIAAVPAGSVSVAFDHSDGSASFTYTNGSPWFAAATGPPNVTNITACSMGDSVSGVACGDASSNASLWFTNDGGSIWFQAANGPTADTSAICMATAAIGYTIDVSSNIWKTTDGGSTWADTTDAMVGERMLCDGSDVLYSLRGDHPVFSKYVNSTNTSNVLMSLVIVGGGNSTTSNIVKATNGNFYFVFLNFNEDSGPTPSEFSGNFSLFKYDGTNTYMRMIGIPVTNGNIWAAVHSATPPEGMKPSLIEVNDVLYLNIQDNIIEINVENE